MTIDALIMLLGVFVVIEPQLGFPNSWDSILLFIAGVVIVGLGIAVRRRGLRKSTPATDTLSQPAAPQI